MGRISCLQVYDQALSVDQIIKLKTKCNQTGKCAVLRENKQRGTQLTRTNGNRANKAV